MKPMWQSDSGSASLYQGDCLQVMPRLAGPVDLILADLPYGTTACKWDTVIPFAPLWECYKRLIKPRGAIVLTASQPFTSALVMSNASDFKYCWYWHKNVPSGFQLATHQPMRAIEEVCVFYELCPAFNRQPTQSIISDRKRVVGASNGRRGVLNSEHGYGVKRQPNVFREHVAPRNVLEIPCVPNASGRLHPTQKPVALMEYLIRTYTNEGDTVLDNTMGSGTTIVAALNTGRKAIGIENDHEIFETALARIEAAVQAGRQLELIA